jgi:hypothetical protein
MEVVRQAEMEKALDRIRDRFGPGSVQRGLSLRERQR